MKKYPSSDGIPLQKKTWPIFFADKIHTPCLMQLSPKINPVFEVGVEMVFKHVKLLRRATERVWVF